ncbi:hypothetical protein IHE44_0002141 [Lamprotornis superbus]|uniref:Translocon-associated protein subunit gamma n=1 Tax=Lamprotornis superbus TaxID=245042 RepID=A0A835NK06_9PASS|nr:hypothetical protein IHE44_0002141 [Lamprotornis superbus]
MAPKGGPGGRQQSEEDLLLQDFSRNLSAKSSALFFGNAFIVSAIPIWLYWRIWHMDLVQSAVLYSVMTLISTYLVAFAYKNVKFVLKHKVAQKREDAVSKEVTRKLSEADNRKMSRKEKDERVVARAHISKDPVTVDTEQQVLNDSHERFWLLTMISMALQRDVPQYMAMPWLIT